MTEGPSPTPTPDEMAQYGTPKFSPEAVDTLRDRIAELLDKPLADASSESAERVNDRIAGLMSVHSTKSAIMSSAESMSEGSDDTELLGSIVLALQGLEPKEPGEWQPGRLVEMVGIGCFVFDTDGSLQPMPGGVAAEAVRLRLADWNAAQNKPAD